jgi:hypothetical protein
MAISALQRALRRRERVPATLGGLRRVPQSHPWTLDVY